MITKNVLIILSFIFIFLQCRQLTKLQVETGLDVFLSEGHPAIRKDASIALVTNQSAITKDGTPIIDAMLHQGYNIVCVFAPEHGFRSNVEAYLDATADHQGILIYNLYDKDSKRPTHDMLNGIETIIYDIQDVGVRYYTYIATMAYFLEAAAALQINIVIFDRPNMIGGNKIEGPIPPSSQQKLFTSYFPIPTRYGMTIGELALMANKAYGINAPLNLIKMQNWKRKMMFDDTQLPWRHPSPNIRNIDQALLYATFGFLESCNIAVGRGTQEPFQNYGMPWQDECDMAKISNAIEKRIKFGLDIQIAQFIPTFSTYTDSTCDGWHIRIDERKKMKGMYQGLALARTLLRNCNGNMTCSGLHTMIGDKDIVEKLKNRANIDTIIEEWKSDPAFRNFLKTRKKYLLYD